MITVDGQALYTTREFVALLGINYKTVSCLTSKMGNFKGSIPTKRGHWIFWTDQNVLEVKEALRVEAENLRLGLKPPIFKTTRPPRKQIEVVDSSMIELRLKGSTKSVVLTWEQIELTFLSQYFGEKYVKLAKEHLTKFGTWKGSARGETLYLIFVK